MPLSILLNRLPRCDGPLGRAVSAAALLLPGMAWSAGGVCSLNSFNDIDFGTVTVPTTAQPREVVATARASYSYTCNTNSSDLSAYIWACFRNDGFALYTASPMPGTVPLITGIPGIGLQLVNPGGNIENTGSNWGLLPRGCADIDVRDPGQFSRTHTARYQLVVTGPVQSGSLYRRMWTLGYTTPAGLGQVIDTRRGPNVRINVVVEAPHVPTCTVDSSSVKQSFSIGTFPLATTFRAPGNASPAKPFAVTLSQCDGALVHVQAKSSTDAYSAPSGMFPPVAGGGTAGLMFQLMDSSGTKPFALDKRTQLVRVGSKGKPDRLVVQWHVRVVQVGQTVKGGNMTGKLVMTFSYF